MPILYKQIPLNPQNGVVTVTPFDPPYDGRKVLFTGNSLGRKIYTVIDGELSNFTNGKRMATGVRGLERFLGGGHEAYAIVVDEGAYMMPTISVPVDSVPVRFQDKYMLDLQLDCSLNLTVSICDADYFADSYAKHPFSPEATIRSEVKEVVETYFRSSSAQWLLTDPLEVLHDLNTITGDLLDEVRYVVEKKYAWCSVCKCTGNVKALNQAEIITHSNKVYEEMEALRKKVLEMQFGMPQVITQCINTYIANNPGAGMQDIIEASERLTQLYMSVSTNTFNQAVQMLGITCSSDQILRIGGGMNDVSGNYLGSGHPG